MITEKPVFVRGLLIATGLKTSVRKDSGKGREARCFHEHCLAIETLYGGLFMESQGTEADISGNSKDLPHLRYPVFNAQCPLLLQLFPLLNLKSLGEIFSFCLMVLSITFY